MKRLLRISTVFLLLSSVDASATVFKCEIDGVPVWQDKDCPSGSTQEVANIKEQNPIDDIDSNSIEGNYLRAYKLIGGSVDLASKLYSEIVNSAGSFSSENNKYNLNVESSSGVVSFVSLGFKLTSPCSQNKNYNHIDNIRLLGLDITLMNKIKNSAYYAESYNDFDNRLKITFMCPFDGGAYTASFSQKYFNQ
jgi:hypothetical protein